MDKLKETFINAGGPEKEAERLCQMFAKKNYKKNEYLLRPNKIARKIFFIESGSVILGILTNKKAITRHLAVAPDFVTVLESFQKQVATTEFLMASVDTEVYELSKQDFDKALLDFPSVQSFYLKIAFELLFKCQQRITDLTSMDASAYYEQIRNSRPELLQQMNQADLATYMGIEPQSLSRLRNKKQLPKD